MIAAFALMAGLAQASASPTWCESIHTLALVTAQAKAAGVPRSEIEAAANRLATPEARAAAAELAVMVYEVDAVGKLNPDQFANLVQRVCEQQESSAAAQSP
ncbi:MAG: hypothetical protein ABW154_06685 [Dyella sp.]